MKLFKYLSKKEWVFMAISLLFIVCQVWFDLKLPEYMTEITRIVNTPGSTIGEIWTEGFGMLMIALGSAVTSIIVGFFAAKVAAGFSSRIREVIFNKVDSFSMEEINKFSIASLITRSTNDVKHLQMFIAMGLQVIVKAPILAVWAVVKMLDKSWELSSATAVAVVALLVLLSVIFVLVGPRFKRIQILTDNLNSVTRENLTGLRVIRAYNAQGYQEEKFNKANIELTENNLFVNRATALMMPGMSIIMNGITLAIYWIGAFLISNQQGMENRINLFGDVMAFSSYAIQVIMAFMMLSTIFIIAPRVVVSVRRINEILDTEPSIVDPDHETPQTDLEGEVEFKQVSFKYPDAEDYVLEDISFKAKKGETIAFIGSTGCGKSSLINLIPRFYDATEGSVLVNGIDVKEYTQDRLHEILGYVPQKAVLFSGTIQSNVMYGQQSEDTDMMKKSIEIAKSADFVEAMDGGYTARVAQGGSNLSGGQKQRLSIARAIYRKPQIFIFDDSFSALDYKTDRELRAELKNHTQDATSLVVAQRIDTIKHADQIIVLEEGKIVGKGTHKQLLASCEVYQEIAYSQLSKEELGYE